MPDAVTGRQAGYAPTLRVLVPLPQPIRLREDDRLSLLVGPGETWVNVVGDGTVDVLQGGKTVLSVNVLTLKALVAEHAVG